MSSYAKLKEMALKKAEAEQAELNREREQKEREAAAKRAAREAQEREQKERERKILVQRMARQKQEEALEKKRKEHAVKVREDKIGQEEVRTSRTTSSKLGLSGPSKRISTETSGSTQKVDLSCRLRANSRNGTSPRKRRKAEEDDFVGNRLDKMTGKKTERAPFSSSGAPKRKAAPLTREEKQAMKRAREFGSLPRLPSIGRISAGTGSSRSSPSTSAGETESRLSARAQLAKDNGLVALGIKKRDHRSIDEIERDLRKLKEAKGQGKSDGPSQADLEREAALLRRQKAMDEKRKADQKAREEAASRRGKGDGDDFKDDLFGSDEDADAPEHRRGSQAKTSRANERPTSANGARSTSTNSSRPPPPPPKEARPIARASGGINPADFLPGAPLRPEAMARLTQKAKTSTESAASRKSLDSASASSTKRAPAEAKAISTTASIAAPPKRETERERFIREQEEKKKAAASATPGRGRDDRRDSRRRSQDVSDSEEDDFDEDEYDSEGIDDDDDGAPNVRDEIWRMFGKDRKKYASRAVDSDDDMEADAASVLQEELRSSKQAREEDLREEQLEKQREREKLLRKKALQQGGR
ncbi:uncharacterized protein MEPE_01140 [Melanopsichium pennsylvanicum]|uniref:SPT2-domain-containing protein n=2 Tax=Melanopsichium pennsylvanicum TaxID=63383 RepID=A0AAJ4XH52_9BASI|nr:conserved hypothetical protein [Melanopsichium pennsylvanicum 4]SNX82434.1 uncharacterized protein MEPE_01140 [Melanopsichium pennsylvanicum]